MFNLFNKKIPSEKLRDECEKELRGLCRKACNNTSDPMIQVLLVQNAIGSYCQARKQMSFAIVKQLSHLEDGFFQNDYELMIDKVVGKLLDEFIEY